jgi:hypothetical protein
LQQMYAYLKNPLNCSNRPSKSHLDETSRAAFSPKAKRFYHFLLLVEDICRLRRRYPNNASGIEKSLDSLMAELILKTFKLVYKIDENTIISHHALFEDRLEKYNFF